MFSDVRVLFAFKPSHKAVAPSSPKPFHDKSSTFNVQFVLIEINNMQRIKRFYYPVIVIRRKTSY